MVDYSRQKECAKEVAESVKKEIMNYFDSLEYGEKPTRLRTNDELAREYGKMLGRKRVSKSYITKILRRYIHDSDLLKFRREENRYNNSLVVILKTREENSFNGRNGADKTNELIRNRKKLKEIILQKEEHRIITFNKI